MENKKDVMMKILALDLASQTGWAFYDPSQPCRLLGTLVMPAAEHPGHRFAALWEFLEEEFPQRPDVIVVEAQTNMRNRHTVKVLCGLRGVALGWAAAHSIPVFEVSPSEVRKWLGIKMGKGVKARSYAKAIELAGEACHPAPLNDDEGDAYLIMRWFEEHAEVSE